MDTEERLASIENRLAAVEKIIRDAQEKAAAFASGPGKKLLKMIGVEL